MNANDFVFNQIYRGCLAKGATERAAKDAAVMAMNDYRKGKYAKKPKELIENAIKKVKKVKK